MNYSISVIIPCYNSSQTLFRAISSVSTQTYLPNEVIIIDDCSNDNNKTINLANELINLFPRLNIQLFQNFTNMGAAFSRNIGLKNAKGHFVAFLDADDIWHPKKLEIQVKYMSMNDDVFLTCHHFKMIDDVSNMPVLVEKFETDDLNFDRLVYSNQFSTPTVMMKNTGEFFFDQKQRYSEDYFLWLTISLSNKKIQKINLPLAFSFKEHYGSSGLSSHVLQMEYGELSNYCKLYSYKKITLYIFITASIFSLIKFFRRIIKTQLKKVYIFVKS